MSAKPIAGDFRVRGREKLIARSREKYADPRTELEAKINRWLRERDAARPRVRKGRKGPFHFCP